MSSTVPQIKNYYESYWSSGKKMFSGSLYGYAPNFRRWMAQEVRGVAADAAALEVGCGDATFTTDLAKHFAAVTAIDISAGQIAENSAQFPGITFRQHDVSERFPFVDGAFQVVWCSQL